MIASAPIVQAVPRNGRAIVTIACGACHQVHVLHLDPVSPPKTMRAACGAEVALSVHPRLAAGEVWGPGDPDAEDPADRLPGWSAPVRPLPPVKPAAPVKPLVHGRSGHLTTIVRTRVLAIVRELGTCTDHDIAAAYRTRVEAGSAPAASPGLLRSVRLQLVRKGRLQATGERRPTPRGRTAREWQATS